MKYMLLIYGNEELWQSFPQEDIARVIAETDALNADLLKSGELIGAYGMADQEMSKQVSIRDGAPVVSDGPYIEAKEYLGSFTLVDCETPERAYEIAALNPFSKVGVVEVRPIMHEASLEV
jgi:hypothetical protein